MASIIDELVIQIRMDVQDLKKSSGQVDAQLKNIRENAEGTGKSMEASGKRAAGFFAIARTEAIALVAVLTSGAGLITALAGTAKGLADFGREARNLNNMSPQALDAWGQALKRIGGSADDAVQSFNNIGAALARQKLMGGSGGIMPFLNAIGAQRTMTPEQVAIKFSEYVAAHPEKTNQELNVIGGGLGMSQSLINLLRTGPAAVAKELELSKTLGLRTQYMIDTATNFQRDFEALNQAARNLTEKLAVRLMPKVDEMLNWMTGWIVAHPAVPEQAEKGITAVSALNDVVIAITKLATGFGSLKETLESVRDAFRAFTNFFTAGGPSSGSPDDHSIRGGVLDWIKGKVGLGPSTPTASSGISSEERKLLDAISGGEATSAGYDTPGGGRYQIKDDTRRMMLKAMGLSEDTKMTPEMQDKVALALAKRRGWTPGMTPEQSAAVLNKEWVSLPGGSQQNTDMAKWRERLGQTGAPGSLTGSDIQAFIMHHTGGRGTVAGVQNTLRQRGLGVQYIMDRDGNITVAGGRGEKQIQPGSGAGEGLNNGNTVGMEIIANDDADITPAQIAAARAFIAKYYPGTRVLGHGEVNPGHKQATEGKTVVDAINADRRRAGPRVDKLPAAALPGLHSLIPSAGERERDPEFRSSNTTNSTDIGHITIHTAATNAHGIAKELHGAISDKLIRDSNRGLA